MEIVCQASTTTHHVFITSSFAPPKRNTEGEGERVRILLGLSGCENSDADTGCCEL